MSSIFQDNTKSIPKSDDQIVRVSMRENEIAGRQDHIPSTGKATRMNISHVPNK